MVKVPVRSPRADLRREVRQFLAGERERGAFVPSIDSWVQGFDPGFSRRLGDRGWLGMTWPKQYGGHERSAADRFVVIEELLASGAPVSAHWIADRQTGPSLLRFGTEEQRSYFLPAIARGELFIAAGMSEPDSGSDLASVRTRAVPVENGWRVNGRKIWTSHAHRSHFLLALVRTSPLGERRHEGLSQLLIDLRTPGIEVRPITVMGGEAHFTEVLLDDVFVPASGLLGNAGDGWLQVTSELAYERSGPERYLSVFPLFVAFMDVDGLDARAEAAIGSVAARLWALRELSLRVQDLITAGRPPNTEAALVKDMGTRLEREMVEIVRSAVASRGGDVGVDLRRLLVAAQLAAPSFTLRGGTVEILRGIIAKGLTR